MASRPHKHLTRNPPTEEEVEKLVADLREVDDRSAAIIGSLLVEDGLRLLLLSGMVNLNSDMRNDLFGPQRPLEAFGARISVAYAFGLLDNRSRKNLSTIRDIRNTFAHAPRTIHFHTPEISDLVAQIKVPNALAIYEASSRDHWRSGLLAGKRNVFLTLCRYYEKNLRATAASRRAA